MRVLVYAALLALANAQGNLNSFEEVRDALISGDELTMTVNSDACMTENLPDPMFVSMPLGKWEYFAPASGPQEIRADDFYIYTADINTAAFILRAINIFEDDTVTVVFNSDSANITSPIVMNCDLGDGAMVHRLIPGNDLVGIDTYQEIKAYLIFGDHVEAVGFLHECANAGDFFGQDQITIGTQIHRFGVNGDGTEEEYLTIYDNTLLSPDGLNFTIGVEQVVLLPDGSANLTIGFLSADDLSPISQINLECELGTALKFTIHERENDETYRTYQEVKEATLNGHDMEAVVFLEFCSVIEGDLVLEAGTIGSVRFDEFQFFEAGGMWGEVEYLAYSTWALDVDGILEVDILRVYESDIAEVELHAMAPAGGGEIWHGTLSCPLGVSTVFHSVKRTRAPVETFQGIVTDVTVHGQVFEVEINYSGCETGDMELGSIYGGIAWQSYVNPSNETGFFYSNMFALIEQNVTGTPGLAWDASGIIVTPDNSVLVEARLYDFYTGENLIADTAPQFIMCQLARESVSFYRYP